MKRGVSILVTIVIVVICTVVRCNKKLDRIERDSKQRREQVSKVNVSYTIDEEDLNRYQQRFLEKQFQKYKEQNEKNQKLVEQLNKYR
jgi:ABC-type sulfate transport system substrate-binding protein